MLQNIDISGNLSWKLLEEVVQQNEWVSHETEHERSSDVGSKTEKDKIAVNLVVSSQDGNKKIENARRNTED